MREQITSFRGENEFLSNFFASPVTIEHHDMLHSKPATITYPTAEHAYQASKSLIFAERVAVAGKPQPVQARRWGKSCRLRPGWTEKRGYVMGEILRIKFAPGTVLAAKLVATGDKEIVHRNTWDDRYWGVVNEKGEWVGENILGKLLMKIRSELRSK